MNVLGLSLTAPTSQTLLSVRPVLLQSMLLLGGALSTHLKQSTGFSVHQKDGTADLRKSDYPLFEMWTVEKLQKCDVYTNQQWLESSVRLASREQFEAPVTAIITENSLVRAMRKWLFPNNGRGGFGRVVNLFCFKLPLTA